MSKKQKVAVLAVLVLLLFGIIIGIPIAAIVDHRNAQDTYLIMCADHGGTPVHNGSHYECFRK